MNPTLKKITTLVAIVLFATTVIACQQRLPSQKAAESSIKRYFKKYGRTYENTDFGDHQVDEVEVNEISELQHDLAQATAFVSLDDGDIVYKVAATLEKRTIRWKVVSWENLGKAE